MMEDELQAMREVHRGPQGPGRDPPAAHRYTVSHPHTTPKYSVFPYTFCDCFISRNK